MHNFPQIKSQDKINREVRRERMMAIAGDILGALALFGTVIVMLFIGYGVM